jgi:L-iditol 2-dehydrogenase
MRATIFEAPGQVSVTDKPLPEPGPGELRVRMAAASLCASDVRVYRGEKYAKPGVTPGHEIAGVVDAVGEGVSGINQGDRVVICPMVVCGKCRFCIVGRQNRCVERVTMGYDLDGGFAEYLLVPERIVRTGHVLQVPKTTPLELAALTEPAACTLSSLDLCGVVAGSSLMVLGAGPMGLLHLMMGRAAGASPIIISEPVAERRDIAKRWGADLVLDPAEDNVPAAVKDATSGYGADAVVLTVGIHDAVGPAIDLVRKQGVINMFAGFPPNKTVPFDPNVIHYNEINLTGSQNATTDQYRRTLGMLEHVPHINELVTNRYDIEHGPEAYSSRVSMSGLKSLVAFAGVDQER